MSAGVPLPASPTRPALRWHGGKWRLAPWIIRHFPPHRVYVEPFGGAASVLLRKARAYGEVYNDLDDEAVGLFKILREPADAAELERRLRLTPFARTEFSGAYAPAGDPIERARLLVVRSFMGFGSDSSNADRPAGFRSNSNRSGTLPVHDWTNYPENMSLLVERLRGVVIECRDARKVMGQHDSAVTLHYVDPPYLPETRSALEKKRGGGFPMYRHELSREDHAGLLDFLDGLAGMVVLSGYPSALYDQRLVGWRRFDTPAFADGAAERTEVLWLNPACAAALDARAGGKGMPLFPNGTHPAAGRKPDRASGGQPAPPEGQPATAGETASEAKP